MANLFFSVVACAILVPGIALAQQTAAPRGKAPRGASRPERRVELCHRSRARRPEKGGERDGHHPADRSERAAWRRQRRSRCAAFHAEAVLQAGVPGQGQGSVRPRKQDRPGVLLRQARRAAHRSAAQDRAAAERDDLSSTRTSPATRTASFPPTAVRIAPMRTRRITAIRSADGRATCSWSTSGISSRIPGSARTATSTATRCASSSGSGKTAKTSSGRRRSKIPRCWPRPGRCRRV